MSWDTSLFPETADQVRALFEQLGMLGIDREPNFSEVGRRLFNIEVAQFVINDPAKIVTDSLTAEKAFDLIFDEAMVAGAGAEQAAVDYVAGRIFNSLGSAPSSSIQKSAVAKGLAQIVTESYNPVKGKAETRKFLTSNREIIKDYYMAPALAAFKRQFLKTNTRATDVALAVCPDLEDEIGDMFISAIIQGCAHITPGNAGQRVLNHGSKALTTGKTP